eukprot:Gb_39317 [translate_table: standard]
MARLQGKGFMEDSPDAMKLTFDDEVGFGWELREDEQLQRQWPTPTAPRGLVDFDQQYTSRDHDHPHRMKSVLQIEKNKANNLKASIIRKKHGYDNVGEQNPIGYDEGEGDEGEENYSLNFHSKSACITSFLTSRRPFDAEDKVEKSHAVIPLEKIQDSDVISHNTNKVSQLVEAIEKMQFPAVEIVQSSSVKTWGEWASEEIKSAQNAVNGFMFPKQAKTNDLYEPKPQTKGTSQSDANGHGEGLSGAVEIGSSVVGKAVGIALALKDVLVYEMGGIKCNASNASETEMGMKEKEEKFNEKMADEEGVQYNKSSKSKFYAETASSAKNAIASKLGYGDELKAHVQGKKPEKDEYAMRFDGGADQNKETLKNSILCKLSPGEEDKALSEVITDAVSHGAVCAKEVLAGGLLQRGSDRTE